MLTVVKALLLLVTGVIHTRRDSRKSLQTNQTGKYQNSVSKRTHFELQAI